MSDPISTLCFRETANHIYGVSNNYKVPSGGGTIFSCPESWPRLLPQIKTHPHNYAIISSHSDYGIYPTLTSQSYKLQSALGAYCGFVHVPPNVVKVYAANCFVNPFRDGRFWFLPFGVLEETIPYVKAAMEQFSGVPKAHKAYISFSALHNPIRESIVKELSKKKYKGEFTIPDKRLSLPEHLEQIARHKFVLCPPGNGADSYRVYESLYLNSIPILLKNRLSLNMSVYFPIIMMKDMCKFRPNDYKVSETDMQQISSNKYLTIEYWRGIINEVSRQCNGEVY